MDLMETLSLLGCTSRTELPLWGWVSYQWLFSGAHAQVQVLLAKWHYTNIRIHKQTPVNQAIFQIRAAICHYFRTYLKERGFTEIQSSKFQQGATESGASVFKVDYFKRNVSLAQSPQLAKQMCMAADMERVFEIGPVFRAENSQTARQWVCFAYDFTTLFLYCDADTAFYDLSSLTEFVGMDLEMTIDNDYHEGKLGRPNADFIKCLINVCLAQSSTCSMECLSTCSKVCRRTKRISST